MKSVEQNVAQHYTHGSLERVILQALTEAGKDVDRLDPPDLAAVDEFHIGGRQATVDFAERFRRAIGRAAGNASPRCRLRPRRRVALFRP